MQGVYIYNYGNTRISALCLLPGEGTLRDGCIYTWLISAPDARPLNIPDAKSFQHEWFLCYSAKIKDGFSVKTLFYLRYLGFNFGIISGRLLVRVCYT
jgi:hypothetical protein